MGLTVRAKTSGHVGVCWFCRFLLMESGLPVWYLHVSWIWNTSRGFLVRKRKDDFSKSLHREINESPGSDAEGRIEMERVELRGNCQSSSCCLTLSWKGSVEIRSGDRWGWEFAGVVKPRLLKFILGFLWNRRHTEGCFQMQLSVHTAGPSEWSSADSWADVSINDQTK